MTFLILHLEDNNIKLFAENNNLFMSAKTMNEFESTSNSYLLNLYNLSKANELHLNTDRPNCCEFLQCHLRLSFVVENEKRHF